MHLPLHCNEGNTQIVLSSCESSSSISCPSSTLGCCLSAAVCKYRQRRSKKGRPWAMMPCKDTVSTGSMQERGERVGLSCTLPGDLGSQLRCPTQAPLRAQMRKVYRDTETKLLAPDSSDCPEGNSRATWGHLCHINIRVASPAFAERSVAAHRLSQEPQHGHVAEN